MRVQKKEKPPVFSGGYLLKQASRKLLQKTLVSSFKMGGFSVWICLALFDILWIAFVSPFLKREARRARRKIKKESLVNYAGNLSKAKSSEELKQAYKAFYEHRKTVN